MAPIAEAIIFIHSLSMCQSATLNWFSSIFQVISQRKLVQSEHYQWKVRVYHKEYLIFGWSRSININSVAFKVYKKGNKTACVFKKIKAMRWNCISKGLRFLQIMPEHQDWPLFFYRICNHTKFIRKYLHNALTDFGETSQTSRQLLKEKAPAIWKNSSQCCVILLKIK